MRLKQEKNISKIEFRADNGRPTTWINSLTGYQTGYWASLGSVKRVLQKTVCAQMSWACVM
jgi:hypothetical protein